MVVTTTWLFILNPKLGWSSADGHKHSHQSTEVSTNVVMKDLPVVSTRPSQSHRPLSVCCPCWFRIWQLNCQNNFLASGSAGGISMKIATKLNIVGSILVWYIHINTFLARAIHCRFATMSPEMREMEHGGCRIASPARAVRALFRLESWATRVGEVDRGTSASSRMTGSAPK